MKEPELSDIEKYWKCKPTYSVANNNELLMLQAIATKVLTSIKIAEGRYAVAAIGISAFQLCGTNVDGAQILLTSKSQNSMQISVSVPVDVSLSSEEISFSGYVYVLIDNIEVKKPFKIIQQFFEE